MEKYIQNGMSGADARQIINNLIDNLNMLIAQVQSGEKISVPLSGKVDGENRLFESEISFKKDSTGLYINGVRYFNKIHYTELNSTQIELINFIPTEAGSGLILEMIKK